MSIFRRNPAPGYSTVPATDPEDGKDATGLVSEWIGGDIASLHDSEKEAVAESWRRDKLRREGDRRRARGEI